MKILNVWYAGCILFCIYSLNILTYESYQVTYHSTSIANGTWSKRISYLRCLSLKVLYPNETEQVDLSQLRLDFVGYFESLERFGRCIEFGLLVSKRIRSGDFLVLKNMACLPENSNQTLWQAFCISREFLRFAYVKNTFNLLEIKLSQRYISMVTVMQK